MSWSNPVHSLKFKVAFGYTLLFFVCCSVVFLVLAEEIRHDRIQRADQATERLAEELTREYLLGNRGENAQRWRPPNELPEPDRKCFEAAHPGLRGLYLAEVTGADGEIYRTFYAADADHIFELRRNRDGSVYSRLLRPENNRSRLRRRAELLVESRGRDNFAIRHRDEAGNLLFTTAAPHASRNFRTGSFPLPDGTVLEIGRNLIQDDRQWRDYRKFFFAALTGVALAGGLAGWMLARRFTAGVRRVTAAARQIEAGDYTHRVAADTGDVEIRELIATFNRMNARTEQLLAELQSVTDHVAHDLRTPLTRISGNVELALSRRDDSGAEYREACVAVAEECVRMRSLLDTMLEISRTHARPEGLRRTPLLLNALLAEAHELMLPLAEEHAIDFRLELPDTPETVEADLAKLQRVVANLLENALKFTPPQGRVELRLRRDGAARILEVSDTGCGIAPAELPQVFERFYRGDASRTKPGNGLGLALVEAVVHAHGWTIEVTSEVGRGSTFRIHIPAGS